ncbi:hypothetical protein AXG93_3256s1860 [Marchantia polymorpha subsp. ruderalis]|uniref:Uncharacterized protein n=1 Tax=Marchantia polymorpha subsp. ruderalis TaxID=1480154 RepID=A0A176VJ21_MARPO|nr:hypothetical protein AXG93_3256s1860 [Marchantia polymorpha subsp. ruderalis]
MDDRGSRRIIENHRVGRNVGDKRPGPNGRFLLRENASSAFSKSFLVKGSSAMRLRRKQEKASSAQATAEELLLRTYEALDIYALVKEKRLRRQSLAFGGCGEFAQTTDVHYPIQERYIESYTAADGSAEATADWFARIPARVDCGEAQLPPVGMEEEASFGALFKHSKSSKNGYKTSDYKDCLRRNVAVALIQLLQPHRTTYMTSWQVGFVELALARASIHWARILWKATRQHAFEEKGGSINQLSPFLINSYRSMECLTTSERVQFPLLSRSNPGRYVKDVEVDTDEDKTPACTPPAQPRAEEEPRAARVPQKRKWEGEAEQSQQRDATAPNRKRAMQELCSRSKQKARMLVLPASSAETGRAAESRNSPSSGEDASARATGRSADLPTPKARTPSEEARRSSGQGRQHAAPTNVPTTDRRFASEQVPFDDSTSGSGAAVAAAKATQPNCRESLEISVATEILNSEDDEDESSSEEQEEESVQGTSTRVLCEQVVPLLRYLDRKVAKYGDSRHRGSYVELVRNRTRIKVMTSPLLAYLDKTVKDLELKNDALRGHLALSRKLQKAVNQMRDNKADEAQK